MPVWGEKKEGELWISLSGLPRNPAPRGAGFGEGTRGGGREGPGVAENESLCENGWVLGLGAEANLQEGAE